MLPWGLNWTPCEVFKKNLTQMRSGWVLFYIWGGKSPRVQWGCGQVPKPGCAPFAFHTVPSKKTEEFLGCWYNRERKKLKALWDSLTQKHMHSVNTIRTTQKELCSGITFQLELVVLIPKRNSTLQPIDEPASMQIHPSSSEVFGKF